MKDHEILAINIEQIWQALREYEKKIFASIAVLQRWVIMKKNRRSVT